MIVTMGNNNINISAETDAAHYHSLGGQQNHFIIPNYGSEFKINPTNLKITLSKGLGSIYGRHILNDGTKEVSMNVTPNSKGYIVLQFDKSNRIGEETQLKTVTTLTHQNLINGGSKYDLPLYEYTATGNSITLTRDLRLKSKNWDYEIGKAVEYGMNENSVLEKEINHIRDELSIIGNWMEDSKILLNQVATPYRIVEGNGSIAYVFENGQLITVFHATIEAGPWATWGSMWYKDTVKRTYDFPVKYLFPPQLTQAGNGLAGFLSYSGLDQHRIDRPTISKPVAPTEPKDINFYLIATGMWR